MSRDEYRERKGSACSVSALLSYADPHQHQRSDYDRRRSEDLRSRPRFVIRRFGLRDTAHVQRKTVPFLASLRAARTFRQRHQSETPLDEIQNIGGGTADMLARRVPHPLIDNSWYR